MKATVTYTIEFEIDSDMDFWEDGREKNDIENFLYFENTTIATDVERDYMVAINVEFADIEWKEQEGD